MQERPINDLVDGLRQIGASIDYLGAKNCPPLEIRPGKLLTTDSEFVVRMKGDRSSLRSRGDLVIHQESISKT